MAVSDWTIFSSHLNPPPSSQRSLYIQNREAFNSAEGKLQYLRANLAHPDVRRVSTQTIRTGITRVDKSNYFHQGSSGVSKWIRNARLAHREARLKRNVFARREQERTAWSDASNRRDRLEQGPVSPAAGCPCATAVQGARGAQVLNSIQTTLTRK